MTAAAVAVKFALVAPAGTVTEAGTVTTLLLLAKLTVNPPVAAAALRVTVQLSVPAPVNDALPQVRAFNTGGGCPPGRFSCKVNVWTTLLALAVSVTV